MAKGAGNLSAEMGTGMRHTHFDLKGKQGTNMKSFTFATITVCSLVASANAGYTSEVIAFTDLADWQNAPADADINLFGAGYSAVYYTENFEGLASGSSVSGGADWAAWTATSSAGLLQTTSTGLYAAQAGATITMNFTASYPMPMGGVRGIGGGFQFVNAEGEAVAGKIWLKLSTGESILRTISSANQFMGFWVADPNQTITSFQIQPTGTSAAYFVGAETMYLGTAVIPAPGAIALLGAAGLISGAGRRRGV
jgi:hypothetical protein